MAIPLATLGQFRIGTTEYGAGRARTDGSWHLVRKEYGNDSSTYSYARFASKADYLAAKANPGAAAWQDEPYSSIDYTLLLAGLVSPLPISTASAGPIASTGSGSSDSAAVVQAIGTTNDKLTAILNSQAARAGTAASEHGLEVMTAALPVRNADGSMVLRNPDNGDALRVSIERPDTPPSLAKNAATETTLAKVLAQLVGTLKVGVDGGVNILNFPAGFHTLIDNPSLAVTGTFWQSTQPVSGTFWQATQPVSGKFWQDTQPVSGTFWQTTQPVSIAAMPTTPVTGTFWQATQPVSGPATDAQLRATPLPVTATVTTSASQLFSLVAALGNNPTLVKAGATQLLGLTVTNAATAYRYIMLYNSATAPATGAAPVAVMGVPPGQSVSLPIQGGKYVAFPTGLSLALGSAASLGTLVAGLLGTTGVGANDMVVAATYA
jgi:hypothetical protein